MPFNPGGHVETSDLGMDLGMVWDGDPPVSLSYSHANLEKARKMTQDDHDLGISPMTDPWCWYIY